MIILRYSQDSASPGVAQLLVSFMSRDRSEQRSQKADNTSGTMICVLSYWRCRLLKVFFLASPVYVWVLLLANLFAEKNFQDYVDSFCPCGPDAVLVAVGCVVMLHDAWFGSGYMHCHIWKKYRHFLDYLGDDFCHLYPAVFGVSGPSVGMLYRRRYGPASRSTEIWIFWKMTSGVQFGSTTVDTRSRAPLGDGK